MKNLKKKYQVKGSLSNVFNALTDEKIIEAWSGAPAQMDISTNGKFSLFGEAISGKNVLVSTNVIIQKWKEKSFGDHFSDLKIDLQGNKDQTDITIDHKNIPDTAIEIISNGWDEHFMGPMIDYIESN